MNKDEILSSFQLEAKSSYAQDKILDFFKSSKIY